MRAERFELMEKLAKLPSDMVFFTQITMEAGEDPQFLDAMRRAHIKGALVGVESVTAEGLKSVFKEFNSAGRRFGQRGSAIQRARRSRARILHLRACLGSAGYLRSDRSLGEAGGSDLRAVRHDDSFSRHGGFRSLGEEHGWQRS